MSKIKNYDYLDALSQVMFKLNEIERISLLREDLEFSVYSKIEDARHKIIDASYVLELENIRSDMTEKKWSELGIEPGNIVEVDLSPEANGDDSLLIGENTHDKSLPRYFLVSVALGGIVGTADSIDELPAALEKGEGSAFKITHIWEDVSDYMGKADDKELGNE